MIRINKHDKNLFFITIFGIATMVKLKIGVIIIDSSFM